MTEAPIEIDAAVMFVVMITVAFFVFMAVWGVARNSASLRDMTEVKARLTTMETSSVDVSNRLGALETQVSHLPTAEHVHRIDVQLEGVKTVVQTTAKQIDRMYDHMMSARAPSPSDGTS